MPSRRSKVSTPSSTQARTPDHTNKYGQYSPAKPQSEATTTISSAALAPPTPPPNWPPSFPYLPHPIISPYLPSSHKKWLHTRPQPPDDLPVITLPYSPDLVASRVEIRVIEDPGHPAFGQRGLFAARDLQPDELVVGYFGYVHGGTEGERAEWERQTGGKVGSMGDGDGGTDVERMGIDDTSVNGRTRTSEHRPGSEHRSSSRSASDGPEPQPPSNPDSDSEPRSNTTTFPGPTHAHTSSSNLIGTWDTSSYDLNMYRTEDIEIAVDASLMGNEARFVNDYRGVPAQRREVGESERDRRDKRRVKGWESGNGDEDEDGTGGGGGNGSYGHGHGYDIAMPNAEFRDVWFDVPEYIDLTLPRSTSSSTFSTRSHDDEPIDETNTSANTRDITSFLTNLHLTNLNTSSTTKPTTPTTTTPLRRKKKTGIRGVAVFVMPAGKAGKRKRGIKKGQEVLVSYGKGFWAHHGAE